MTPIAIAEIISTVFVFLSLINQFAAHKRSTSSKRLIILYLFALVLLPSDALCYILNGPQTSRWILYVFNILAYSMSNIALIGFMYYCDAYIREQTSLNLWVFRIPSVILAINTIIEIVYFLRGEIAVFKNGEFVEVGAVPAFILAIDIAIMLYAPVIAFVERKKVGNRSVVLLTGYALPVIVSILILWMTGRDYTILSGALSIAVTAALLQNDLNQAQNRTNEVHRTLVENNARVLALEDTFESLFDVDLETGRYEQYIKSPDAIDNADAKMAYGNDYFGEASKNIDKVVFPEDRESITEVLNGEFIRDALEKDTHIDRYYRLVTDGNTVWLRMRILYKNAEKKNIIVGVFNAEEEVAANNREIQRQEELINKMTDYDSVFLIDCKKDRRKTIHDYAYGSDRYSDDDSYTDSIERYVSNCVAGADYETMREVTSIEYMLDHLKDSQEYSIRYRDITTGIPRFYEMRTVKFSDTEVLQCFAEKDEAIIDKMIFDSLEEDYFALFCVNLSAGVARVMKKSPWYVTGEVGEFIPFTQTMESFAAAFDGETREFFENIGNIEYLKQRFLEEDKASYAYRSHIVDGNKWVNVMCLVLSRDDDGTPSLLAFGFSLLDEKASEKEEAMLKLRESMSVVGGLAGEYTALYHINLFTGEFRNYRATDRIQDTRAKLGKYTLFTDLFNDFIESDAVHPDFKESLHDFYESDDALRNILRDKKSVSTLFKRKYGDEYLWTDMTIVKCEDEDQDAQSAVIGFIEKDKEIRERAEQFREAEEADRLIENIASKYHVAYTVNMADNSYKILRMDDHVVGKGQKFADFSEVRSFFISAIIHPGDREYMQNELEYDTIRQRLSSSGTKSYSVEYRVLIGNATIWHEMIVTSLGGDNLAIGFAEKDLEIIKRHLENKRYDEYLALFVIDIDTGMIKAVKTSPYFKTAEPGEAVPYEPAMKVFASIYEGETKKYFTLLSDLEYAKRELASDDKRTYSYKSARLGDDKWIDVISYVTQRHADGTPSTFTLGFSLVDALATVRQEIQRRLNEDNQMIGGLASEYHALYYFNIDEGFFKIYSLDKNVFPEASRIASESVNPFETFRRFGMSDLVHPDDRHLFRELDVNTLLERLSDRKTFSLRFRRNYDGEYLWTEMDVIKYESIDEPANAIAIGFAERDAEIRSEQALNSCFGVLGKDVSPYEAIDELLSVAGDFYGAERCYIFEYAKGKEVINNTYEWCADGITAMLTQLQNVPAKEIDGWIKEFNRCGAFYMDAHSAKRNTKDGIAILEEMQGIENLIAAPILNGEEIVGFIGVDNPSKAKNNTNVLKNVAVVAYSEILKRKENDEEHVTLEKLTDTFVSVYYADLTRDYMHNWKIDSDYQDAFGAVDRYSISMGNYVREGVAERDRDRCMMMTGPEYVLEQFKTKDRFSIDMTDIVLGYERNFVFDYVKVNDEGTQLVICCRDVTENIAKEKEQQNRLREAYDAAEAANRSKTHFLFNMSHDIRTPMNAITGFTNMAIKHIDDREKAKDCLGKIQQSGNMLLSLINSVLEVSRIESGKAVLEEQPGNVYYSFTNIESTMRELAKAKDIDLTFEIDNIKDRYVLCDFSRCMRIFVNIISNAIKYTKEGGFVRVRCEQIGEANNGVASYRYTVADNGIGMSEEFQKHVFEQFAREKTATVSGIQGTGLGMAVCKSFVDLMGGTIECKSRQGVGTTFTVTLPFKLQDGEQFTDPLTGDVVENGQLIVQEEEIDFAGRRLLLVEDNELNREIANDILEDVGFCVESANDGIDAIEKLSEKGPEYYDFILMDIQMPIMGGYEATRRIREMYPDADIPIIALSANAFAEDKAESIAAGMNDHVAKPINIKELLNVLAKYLH